MKKTVFLHGKKSGQAMGLTIMVLLVLCMFTFMIVNFFEIEYNRMKMQNAADAAALTQTRLMAYAMNKISQANLAKNVCGLIKIGSLMAILKDTKPVFQAESATQKLFNRWGGGFVTWGAREAAKANGADKASLSGGGASLKLTPRKRTIVLYKLITVPILGTIPFPVGRFKDNYAFVERKWEPNKKKAYPPHWCLWRATKNSKTPFAAGLLGIKKSKNIMATAKAEVWLDMKKSNFWHNGGFPYKNQSFWDGIGIQSFWPAFNARLVNVPAMQH